MSAIVTPAIISPNVHSPGSLAPVRMLESPRLVGSGSGAAEAADRKSEFSDILEEAVARVENYRAEADRAVDRFLRGEDQEIHRVALAVQESEIAMELFLQAKNKVVQAYQEVMRMQL